MHWGWSKSTSFEKTLQDNADDFYFLGKDIIELGVADSQFYATKTARDAYYVLIDANSKEKQAMAFRHIVENKRISNFTRVDYIGDVDAGADRYDVNIKDGVITVHISAIPKDIEDNAFIDDYLKKTFNKYYYFIKQYLAMYVYSNYVQLPTLILYGPRGSSKTTFSEMVGAIYPNLYIDWQGDVNNFTPEAEKKLAVIEENDLNATVSV